MAAHENLSNLQFQYRPPEMGRSTHHLLATTPEGEAGMEWTAKHIVNISVPSTMQRQGIGTALWNEGHRLASESKRVPAPKHSKDRTDAGDAWARSIGGSLPRRSQAAQSLGTLPQRPRDEDDDLVM